jgi:micrococcal nuclease
MLAQIAKITCLIIPTFLLLLTLCGCGPPPDTARVIEIVDGDTIIIEGNYHVRYIGIDTREAHPEAELFSVRALKLNRDLVEGKVVRLEKDVSDKDKYGRLLRYVYVDDLFVNAELVREGLAWAKAYPPDTKYQEYLTQLENEAREAGRGMWAK